MSNFKDYTNIFDLVLNELEKAEKKHQVFPVGAAGVSLIAEELGELAQAVNDGDSIQAVEEAAHVAVTAIRFIKEVKNGK